MFNRTYVMSAQPAQGRKHQPNESQIEN